MRNGCIRKWREGNKEVRRDRKRRWERVRASVRGIESKKQRKRRRKGRGREAGRGQEPGADKHTCTGEKKYPGWLCLAGKKGKW